MDLVQPPQMVVQHAEVGAKRQLKILKAQDNELVAHEEYIKSLAKAGAKSW